MQSKANSFIESLVNVGVGFCVSLGGQLIILPAYGVHLTLATNMQIIGWFTALSVARSYVVRRWFTGLTE